MGDTGFEVVEESAQKAAVSIEGNAVSDAVAEALPQEIVAALSKLLRTDPRVWEALGAIVRSTSQMPMGPKDQVT